MNVIYETSGQQGIILNDGNMALIVSSEESKLHLISEEGEIKRSITLKGLFFDFKVTDTGKFVCLGFEQEKSVIRITTSCGTKITDIYPLGMIFASCIYLDDDYIYVGGFDNKNIFKIEILNFAGVLINSYEINSKSNNRIISKILKIKDNLIISITGDDDNIGILNLSNGKYNEISPFDLKIKYITDINANDEMVRVLDGKYIYEYKIMNILNGNYKRRRFAIKKLNLELFPYAYLMYLCGIEEGIQKLSMFYPLQFCILTIISLIYFKADFNTTMLFLSFVFLFSIFVFICINIKVLFDRENRVEYLLKTTLLDKYSCLYLPQVFISAVVPSIYVLLAYPEVKLSGFYLCFICSMALFLSIGEKCKKRVKKNNDIIIELLTVNDEKIKDYIKSSIERTKDNKTMKMYMEVNFSSKVNEACIKRWVDSRKFILKSDINYKFSEGYIMFDFDFSKRDIRYSISAILIDCIGFLKRYFSIKEIHIYSYEEKIVSII